jgi:hypothetical protein
MHVPDDWQILHFDRPRVVEGIVRSLCRCFNVAYDIVPPVPPTTPPTEPPIPPPPVTPTQCQTDLAFCEEQITQAKDILYGKGFIWNKLSRLKTLLPKV